ncbi:MAG: vitamin K epoxide reductase family protein [Gemmatimonadota bacterium]|nr:vitamin K epoxide reductase family protein [Gemmatimonadota bacterium]
MTLALWTARILALAGFLDAAWLTANHYAGEALTCGPGGGCEVVLTSEWATVGVIPTAAIGLAYYVAATLIAWTPRESWNRGIAILFAGLEGVALVVSGALVWIQATRIHSWCRFCLFSALVTLGLFVCAIALLRAFPRESRQVPPG